MVAESTNPISGEKLPEFFKDNMGSIKADPRPPSSFDKDTLEPVAIIGLSLRFPQNATSESEFWEMLLKKQCASTDYPGDRMNIDAFFNPDPNKINTISTRGAHFLRDDFRVFDAAFFSIAPAEAASMDPQQRGLLETTYLALENAGIPLTSIRGSKTSVHVGSFITDFKLLSWKDAQQIPRHGATGDAGAILSNRLSWFFDLKGPSVTIDTACSSGMVALDMSCAGLWAGDSSIGIVAGSNLIFSPEMNIVLSNMNFLSPDARCYSFDHRANGYSRGEGFGVIVLKLLSKAIQDGDTIRALIRSTGVNQDGHTSSGITQPSKDSQAQLISDTYQKAGLDKQLTRYFEAHGTGTAIGDPLEARAIGESFYQSRCAEDPLYIGAVKANIGHLEGASGLAGLIKTIKVLESAIIPPNANFEKLNPRIDAEFFNLKFPSQCIPWPSLGVRRASVNSFGFGGTNAHAVLDDASHYLQSKGLNGNHRTVQRPPQATSSYSTEASVHNIHQLSPEVPGCKPSPKILLWSASSKDSLLHLIKDYGQHFSCHTHEEAELLEDLSFTLNCRRSSLVWKAFLVTSSVSDLISLESGISKAFSSPDSPPNLGFVFSGQGGQWYAMGRELRDYPVFRNSLERSESVLKGIGCSWGLIAELEKDKATSKVNDPEYSQTLSTALQIALVDLLKSAGVLPMTVIGHSSGEIAAAYCAGAITHSSALRIAYFRGVLASKLSKSTQPRTRMASIGISEAQLHARLEEAHSLDGFDPSLITVSCINSPNNVTIAGPERQLETLVSHMKDKEIFARMLRIDVGYHSPQMLEISAEYENHIQNIEQGARVLKASMISSVSAEPVSAKTLCTSQYWVRNMLSPVKFSAAMTRCYNGSSSAEVTKKLDRSHLNEAFVDLWLEIGPHSTFQGPIRDILTSVNVSNQVHYTSTLVRWQPATKTVLEAAARLYCQGCPLDIQYFNDIGPSGSRKGKLLVDLPQYPFDHSVIHWEEPRLSEAFRFRHHPDHELLGSQMIGGNSIETWWRHTIHLDNMPWIQDHKINDTILFPAAGMIAMAVEAVRQIINLQDFEGVEIRNVTFHKPLVLTSNKKGTESQLCLRSVSSSAMKQQLYEFKVYACTVSDAEWNEICRGSIRLEPKYLSTDARTGQQTELRRTKTFMESHALAETQCTNQIEQTVMYQRLKDIGMAYGPSFETLDHVHFSSHGEAVARLSTATWHKSRAVSAPSEAELLIIHPTTLDGIFQLAFAALCKGDWTGMATMIPSRIDRLWVYSAGVESSSGEPLNVHAKTHQVTRRSARLDISVIDETCRALKVVVEGFEVTAISNENPKSSNGTQQDHFCYYMDWKFDVDTLDGDHIFSSHEDCQKTKENDLTWLQDLEVVCFFFGSKCLADIDRLHQNACPFQAKYHDWLRQRIQQGASQSSLALQEFERKQTENQNYVHEAIERISSKSLCRLYLKFGHQLANIVLGEVSPLDILHDDLQLLADANNETVESLQIIRHLEGFLEALAHKLPALKVLEIGAGTGAMTKAIHKILGNDSISAQYGSYTFTDVEPHFIETAAENFLAQKKMEFRALDIGSEPSMQGYTEHSYDLIVVSNALYRTRTVERSLANIRKLLKLGGKLILVEPTVSESVRDGFISALFSGWWPDTEGRETQDPYASEENWGQLLNSGGFSGLDATFRGDQNTKLHSWSLMISTAVAATTQIIRVPPEITVIVDQESQTQIRILADLRLRLQNSGTPVSNVVSFQEVSRLKSPETRHYIILCDIECPLLLGISPEGFMTLKFLLSSAKGILWVTGGAQCLSTPNYGMVQGLCRVSRQEHMDVQLVTLALQETSVMMPVGNSCGRNIAKVFSLMTTKFTEGNFETEYVEMDGCLHINRLVEDRTLNEHISAMTTHSRILQRFGEGPPLKLDVPVPGVLESLIFVEDPLYYQPLAPEEIEIEVRAIGVNFKDCLTVLGRIDRDVLGSDCAGIIRRVGSNCISFKPGDRVVAGTLDVYKSYVRADSRTAVRLRTEMPFTEAAAIPTVFCTAYYCLDVLASVRKGESILIHAASGGTGQAAIQIATLLEAEIFATVGSTAKKELLMNTYSIPEDHIFHSRDLSFVEAIKSATHNKGVDVVLNSLSGEFLIGSWECIAPDGRFIEIGKGDIESRGSLPMYPFSRNASFIGFDLALIFERRPALVQHLLGEVMALFSQGKLKVPHPLEVLPIAEIEKGFQSLQSGKSSGKIILEMGRDTLVPKLLQKPPEYSFEANATYVIAGGLGGLGRSIARWLVSRGAKSLLLLSRSGPGNNKARAFLAELQSKGILVKSPACNINCTSSLQNVIDQYCGKMPPIKGCFQASMVIKDAILSAMTFEDWIESTEPKVKGSWNLHNALPRGMSFFILLSSTVGVFGSAGQSNYAAGNTYQDALAQYRVSCGERAVSLDLGFILAEGFVAENAHIMERLKRLKELRPITLDQFYALLDFHCSPLRDLPMPSTRSQVITGLELPATIRERGDEMPYALQQPMFRRMQQLGNLQQSNFEGAALSYKDLFSEAKSWKEAGALVSEALRDKLSRVLDIPRGDISLGDRIESYGVDSLVATQLRNWLSKEMKADVAIFEILGGSTLMKIGLTVATKSLFRKSEWTT